ncbi:MAG TPA: hypothetical protein EYH09_00150 [Candidatus Nanopusillus sp.]|nr:hypothetical protein [Candidatus Nanopusillus sp.]
MKNMNKKISEHYMYLVIAVIAAVIGVIGAKLFLEPHNVHVQCTSPEKVTKFLSKLYTSAGYTIKNISVSNVGSDKNICWYDVTTYFEMANTTYKSILKVPVVGEYVILRGIDIENDTPLELKVEKLEALFKPVKTERPKVKLYLMSLCPFGTRAFEELYKFYSNTKFFDIEPIFIVSSTGIPLNETTCKEVGVWYNGKCYTSLHGKEELLIDIVLYNIYRKHGFDTFSKVYMKFLDVLKKNNNITYVQIYDLFKNVLSEEGYNIGDYLDLSILPELEQNTVLKGITASPIIYVNDVRVPYNPLQEPAKVYGAICASTTTEVPECDRYTGK